MHLNVFDASEAFDFACYCQPTAIKCFLPSTFQGAFVPHRLLAVVDKNIITVDVRVVFRGSAVGSFAILIESSNIVVQHDAVVDELGLPYECSSAEPAAYGIARGMGLCRLVRAVSQAKCTVGVCVFHVWFERAPEVDAVGVVRDNVVAALFTFAFAFLVVAAQGVLLEVVGRYQGC
jgi:hypothetical protein